MAHSVVNYGVRGCFLLVLQPNVEELGRPIANEEIKNAVFAMAPLKSLGLDGIHALFYQRKWSIVGESICDFVRRVFEENLWHEDLNHTILVLLSKVGNHEFIYQLRSISLCNVIYKVITKVVVNQLNPFLPIWVVRNQTSFVSGRTIVDNVVVAKEVGFQKGQMPLKINLKKAYDHLEWDFIVIP
ncbi:hypothetical protein GQ457_16G015760 [Hibiscus cannabinus]